MVLLDDLERSFEGEEDTLTTSCLKLCLTSSPARWLEEKNCKNDHYFNNWGNSGKG